MRTALRVAILAGVVCALVAVFVGVVLGAGTFALWALSFLPSTAKGFVLLALKVGLGVAVVGAAGAFPGLWPPRRNDDGDTL